MSAKMMKCARFPAAGKDLEICQVPIPNPGKNQVRIQVYACGLCHTDLGVGSGANPAAKFPLIPGHEVGGVIDEIGEDVTQFKKGDKVGVGWFGGHCGKCRPCIKGDWVCCDNVIACGTHYDGGFAEYVVVPTDAVARIPADLDFKLAGPLMCAGLTTFNGIRNQGLIGGDIVAVQGIGGLGHLAIQFANRLGFKVVAISSGKDKEKLAKDLGAHIFIDTSTSDPVKELQKMGGANLIVCTAPHAKAVSPLVDGLAVNGKLMVVALIGEPLEVNAVSLLIKNRSVVGWASGDSRHAEDTLNFSATTGVKPMIETFPLEKVNEAVKKVHDNTIRFRAVLVLKE